jgi:hypothetical protein
MLIQDAAQKLERHGTKEIEHTRRTFFEHLSDTGDLLKYWGCRDALCVAGYFHSFYGSEGTTAYASVLQFSDRERLRAEIGEESEELVYLYCISQHRPRYSDQLGASTCFVKNRLTGEKVPTSAAILADLIALDCADLVEQFYRQGLRFRLYHRSVYRRSYLRASTCLPRRGREAVHRMLSPL